MTIKPPALLVAAAVVAVGAAGCSDFILRDNSPVTLVIDRLEAAPVGTTDFAGTLQSDVLTEGGVFSDSARVTMRLVSKNPTLTPSPVNAVTIHRYRVTFRRSDGRNVLGQDIPFPFDSATSFTVPPGGSVTQSFELIRHSAKLESPLGQLAQGLVIISTVADVTFFGRDQVGNDLSATGSMGVQFGDFADPED